MIRLNRRAQSTAEYAVLIAVVIGAVVAMQTYMKRRIQGLEKGAADSVQIPGANSPLQYEPYYAASDTRTGQQRQENEQYNAGNVQRVGQTAVQRVGAESEGGADRMGADDVWDGAR